MKSGIGYTLAKAYFFCVLLLGMTYAFFCNPLDFAYDITLVWAPLTLAASAVALWLLARRARVTRAFCLSTLPLCFVLAIYDLGLLDAFDVVAARLGTGCAGALVAAGLLGGAATLGWLALSPTSRETLTEPLDLRPVATGGHSWDTPLRERVRTPVFWRDLSIYFTSFSFIGHWAEMLFCMCIVWGIFDGMYDFREVMLWHQWLFPYLAEAIAMVLVVCVLHPFKQWLQEKFGGRVLPTLVLSIALTACVCVTIDFTAGMICNQDYSVWDYRDMPFNFMGQVCLQNSCVYTLAATLLVWVIYPALDHVLRRSPRDVVWATAIALLSFFCFCALLHFVYVDEFGHLALGMVMLPK